VVTNFGATAFVMVIEAWASGSGFRTLIFIASAQPLHTFFTAMAYYREYHLNK